MRLMTFEFEYFSEFKFILKNNQEEEWGDQECAFDEKKKPEAENLVQVYL